MKTTIRCSWARYITAFLLLCMAGNVFAQDLEPRRWTHMPNGLNVVSLALGYGEGDNYFDPVLQLDPEVRARAARLAERVGIEDKLGRFANQLSQGERQRVAVCRALLVEPELLLADEPTGNLDPANKGRVLDILVDHAEESGATLVLVTHDRDLLDRFQRVIDFREFHGAAA